MSEQAINLKRIERSLAYEQASSLIESSCARVERDGDYYDLYDLDDVDEAVGDLSEEAGYLESRGLLVRQPDKPNLVEIRDEGEATEVERLAIGNAPKNAATPGQSAARTRRCLRSGRSTSASSRSTNT
jgi:hypothetical protein